MIPIASMFLLYGAGAIALTALTVLFIFYWRDKKEGKSHPPIFDLLVISSIIGYVPMLFFGVAHWILIGPFSDILVAILIGLVVVAVSMVWAFLYDKFITLDC